MLDFNDRAEIRFQDAVDIVYTEVLGVLQSQPSVSLAELPSHVFGGKQIQPLVPPLTFELSKDFRQFDTKFGRISQMPQGQVLKQLMDIEQQKLEPTMLNTLFEFDIAELKKSAACAEIKFDTAQLIDPLLDSVYQGIAGMRYNDPGVLSCTALSLEC